MVKFMPKLTFSKNGMAENLMLWRVTDWVMILGCLGFRSVRKRVIETVRRMITRSEVMEKHNLRALLELLALPMIIRLVSSV